LTLDVRTIQEFYVKEISSMDFLQHGEVFHFYGQALHNVCLMQECREGIYVVYFLSLASPLVFLRKDWPRSALDALTTRSFEVCCLWLRQINSIATRQVNPKHAKRNY
jgi:hypothetical protein